MRFYPVANCISHRMKTCTCVFFRVRDMKVSHTYLGVKMILFTNYFALNVPMCKQT